jgi:hypothetical protein
MLLRNMTNVPDKLIEIAVAFSIQENIALSEIVIKNKQAGIMHGQLGWYYPTDKKVVVIVPPEISEIFGMSTGGRYTHLNMKVFSRAEFIVAVMAHELRHAWQYQASGNPQMYARSRGMCERDAEQYQYGMLAKWRRMIQESKLKGVA